MRCNSSEIGCNYGVQWCCINDWGAGVGKYLGYQISTIWTVLGIGCFTHGPLSEFVFDKTFPIPVSFAFA